MAKGRKSGASRAVRAATGAESVSKAAQCVVAIEDVFTAVLSLYGDQLKPYSRIVRKRLVEQAEARGVDGKDCDNVELRALCEACAMFRVCPEEGGEWSVLLLGKNHDFIDIYSSVDNYPEELWSAAQDYFKNLGNGENGSLPGGRYASAHALTLRGLPFFIGYSLGQVCHITELAISQRKLLGYANGAIVAYDKSTSLQKKTCATEHRAIDTADGHGIPYTVVDWDMARVKLGEILVSAQQRGSEFVPISNVKRLFRSLYHMELSETSLGYAKLTELLQDERFKDVCSVQLQDRGYVVVPVDGSVVAPVRVEFCRDEPLCLEEAEPAYACSTPSPSPQYPRIGLKPRLPYLEMNDQSLAIFLGLEPFKSGECVEESQQEEIPISLCERVRFCPDEPLDVDDIALESPDFVFPTPSPSPQYPMGDQSFKHLWERNSQSFANMVFQPFRPVDALTSEPDNDDTVKEQPSRIRFCVDEPLCVQEAGLATTLATSPGFQLAATSPYPQGFQLPTPSPYPQYSRRGMSFSRITPGCR